MLFSNTKNPQHEVEEHELSIIKEFESRILSLQDEDSTKRLIQTTSQSESLARLSRSFRQYMRSIGGEDADRPLSSDDTSKPTEDFEPWNATSGADWALERECELARLERENEELRRMLGADVPRPPSLERSEAGESLRRPPTMVPSHDNRTLEDALGRSGSTGPYGTVKNVRSAG